MTLSKKKAESWRLGEQEKRWRRENQDSTTCCCSPAPSEMRAEDDWKMNLWKGSTNVHGPVKMVRSLNFVRVTSVTRWIHFRVRCPAPCNKSFMCETIWPAKCLDGPGIFGWNWNRGVVHSQIGCTDFKSFFQIFFVYLYFFGFLDFFRFFGFF